MSKQIDEKVVSMEFDNKRFEENVKTSMNTIDKLKKSLNFDSAAKGFESINEASKNVQFDSIASGVESLQNRFSTFGIVGMRVIENITDSVIRLSKKTMSFITEGIIQGGKKRAMNLENAHFQLQGLLKDEEAVSAVMKNVNDSVDGTAYSLDSAAKVAAQLAASGMRAGDQMFSSLRAVAGVAAMTNSEYDDIGRIFTKVSGQGRLMGDDLLSLSSRGMNAAATLGNYLHKTEAEVRDMVSKGKIGFATFSAAMDDAYGEHAKKANETLIGSLSNVKAALARIGAAFFTPLVKQNGVLVNLLNTVRERVNDVKAEVGPFADLFVNSVSKIAEKSNEFLKNLKVTNYVKSIYNSILAVKNIFNGLLSLLNPIGKAFREVFSPIDSSTLLQYSERLIDLTSKFKLSNEAAEKLRSTFNSFFSVCKSVINALKTLTERVYSSFSSVSTFDDMFLSLLSTVEKVGTKLGTFFVHIIDKIREGGPSLTKILDTLTTSIKNFGKNVFNFLGDSRVVEGGVLVALVYWLRKLLYTIQGTISRIKNLTSVGDAINKFLVQLSDTLFQMENQIRYDALTKMAGGILILAIAIKLLSTIDTMNLTKSLGAVIALMYSLVKAMDSIAPKLKSFSKNGGSLKNLLSSFAETKMIDTLSRSLLKFSIAILILSFAVKNLAGLDLAGLFKGLFGIGAIFLELAGFLKLMEKIGSKNFATKLIPFSVGILILSYALEKLGKLSWEEIGRGLSAMGGALTEMVAVIALLGKCAKGSSLAGAISILIISLSLNKIYDALKGFGSMSWNEIGRGLVAMGGALTELALIAGLLGKLGGLSSIVGAVSILIIAQALKPIGEVLSSIGQLSWSEIGRGLVGMGGALTELALITGLLGNLGGLGALLGAGSILLAVQGLGDLADALKKFGEMSWDEIGRGLTAMGAALGEVALGSLLNTLSGLGSKSIAEVAEPLGTLADSVSKWSGVTVPEGLGEQMSTLASAIRKFIFTGLGSKSIAEVAEPLGTLADSVAKWSGVTVPFGLGAQLVDLANGVYAFSATFAGGWSISEINGPFSNLADSVAKWKDVTIPYGIGAQLVDLANGVYAFSATFAGGWSMSQITEPLGTLADSVSKWSGVTVPADFKDNIERIVESIKQFSLLDAAKVAAIDEPLNKLSLAFQNFSSITGTGENLVTFATNIKSSGDKVSDIDSKAIDSASSMIDKFMNVIKKVNSIDTNNISSFVNAANELNNIKIDSIQIDSSNLSSTISSIKKAMESVSNAISSSKTSIDSATKTAVSGCAGAVREKIASMESAGKDLGDGLIRGINSKKQDVYNAGFELGQRAVQGEKDGQKSNSPSKLTIKAGKWLGEGLVIGIQKMGNSVYQSGYNLGETATDAISSTISRIADVLDSDIDTQPTIRPVLDLSDVSAGAGTINRMFGTNPSIGVLARVNSISSMMNSQNGSNKEVISAIKDLGNKLDNKSGDTYNFGDFTYDDGSNVSDAVRTLVRAVRIEGRK